MTLGMVWMKSQAHIRSAWFFKKVAQRWPPPPTSCSAKSTRSSSSTWRRDGWSTSLRRAIRPRHGRAQQLRNATMDGDAPAVLLRDRDDKFGPEFDRAAQGVGARVIRTAVRAPNMNAVAERFVGSARRELLDHVLLIDDQRLADLLRQYQRYFNESRPHQGIEQRVPAGSQTVTDSSKPVAVTSVLGGLHVDYRRAA